MLDIDLVRGLLEKLNLPYTTRKAQDSKLLQITVSDTPKIAFTFFEDGSICSLYNEW